MLLRKPASELSDEELCTNKITVGTERVNELRRLRVEVCGFICRKVS